MIGLAGLIEDHRAAFEHDWRTRFHLSLTVVGTDEMTWGEALRQTGILRADPSSQIAAALEGWKFSASREVLALYDLFDLEHAVNSKRKPKPHSGRPFRSDDGRRHGKPRLMTEAVAILNRFGHSIPV